MLLRFDEAAVGSVRGGAPLTVSSDDDEQSGRRTRRYRDPQLR
jgi:hypothetical protein